jgi:hypothetical protein
VSLTKFELQKALFPDGLVWSHETGFLNRKNRRLMEGLGEIFQELPDPQLAVQRLIDKFGVPDGTVLHQLLSRREALYAAFGVFEPEQCP